MTKSQDFFAASAIISEHPELNKHAIKRANIAIGATQHVLPKFNQLQLAHEVIKRLARGTVTDLSMQRLALVFADTLVGRDPHAAQRLALWLMGDALSAEDLISEQLTAAARVLNERYDKGDLTPDQMSAAAARLYTIIRGLAHYLSVQPPWISPHAVFATVPGERHTTGVSLAADLFRRDGWAIDLLIDRNQDALLDEMSRLNFAILGVLVHSRALLPSLIHLVAAVRVSFPHVRILVAGNLVENEPRLKGLTDVDFVSNRFDTLRAVMSDFHQMITAQAQAVPS